MDIEELSKTQIILLVLLVTFVTSIATGIVTVSLLAQAPPAVTQTVNHIVQRTVETIAPSSGGTKTETVKETTVVVKEDDLVTASIASSFAKIALVHESEATSSTVVSLGAVVTNGIVISDSSVTNGKHAVQVGDAFYLYETGKGLPEVALVALKPVKESPPGFRVADASSAKLGALMVALPSAAGTRVGIGALTARYTLTRVTDDKELVPVRAVETSITGRIAPGTPLINAFGDLVGIASAISLGESGGAGTFVAASDIAPFLFGVKGTSTEAVQ